MIAVIKLYTNKKSKKGYPVVFYFRNGVVRKRVSLGMYFEKHDWNFEDEMPKPSAKNYNLVYPVLLDFKHSIQKLYFRGENDINAYLLVLKVDSKNEIQILQNRLKRLQNENMIGILAFFDVVINEKTKKGESVRSYKEVKAQFEKYLIEDEPLNNITYEWLNSFIVYKKSEGTGLPGIMAYLRTLRALYKEAQKRTSLNVKNENPFLGVIKNPSSVKNIEFTPADFKKLLNYTPNVFTPKDKIESNKRAVSLWLFQFVIGGHDLADVANLSWKNYKNNRLQFKRYKNRNKPNGGNLVNNKMLPFAKWFIEKYADKKSKKLFSFIPNPATKKYEYFRRNYNRTLKAVSENTELTSVISSKSTRYIFRTYGGELLINDLVIMQLQGHKPTGVTFNYQQSLPNSVIDTHHKVIVEKAGVIQDFE